MKQRERAALHRELVDVKTRLRRHGLDVAYGPRSRSLAQHIADIKRRDEIERLIVEDDQRRTARR